MAQRLGAVFAIAIATAVFSSYGSLGTPATVTAGFQPALWACAGLAVLAAISAVGITSRRSSGASTSSAETAELPLAA
jgi:hypothetical protein